MALLPLLALSGGVPDATWDQAVCVVQQAASRTGFGSAETVVDRPSVHEVVLRGERESCCASARCRTRRCGWNPAATCLSASTRRSRSAATSGSWSGSLEQTGLVRIGRQLHGPLPRRASPLHRPVVRPLLPSSGRPQSPMPRPPRAERLEASAQRGVAVHRHRHRHRHRLPLSDCGPISGSEPRVQIVGFRERCLGNLLHEG
jgi:hypothetical protein